MVLENKVNEEGYTSIEKFYVLDNVVYGRCDRDFTHIISYVDGEVYIKDKCFNKVIDVAPLPITSREDLSVLFKSIRQNKIVKSWFGGDSIEMLVSMNGKVHTLEAIIITNTDDIKGLYCMVNGIVYELHSDVNQYGQITKLLTGSVAGRIEDDSFILNNNVHVNVPIMYEFDIQDIIKAEIKFKGRHYGC